MGGPDGSPLQVVLTRQKLEEITEHLWRRASLPLDQACGCIGCCESAFAHHALAACEGICSSEDGVFGDEDIIQTCSVLRMP